MEWGATYFSIRSNVTPGTNLALFCIQNLQDRSKGGLGQSCNKPCNKKRGSDNRKCKAFTLLILWAKNTRRNISVTNESRKKLQLLSSLMSGFWPTCSWWQETKSYFRKECLPSAGGSAGLLVTADWSWGPPSQHAGALVKKYYAAWELNMSFACWYVMWLIIAGQTLSQVPGLCVCCWASQVLFCVFWRETWQDFDTERKLGVFYCILVRDSVKKQPSLGWWLISKRVSDWLSAIHSCSCFWACNCLKITDIHRRSNLPEKKNHSRLTHNESRHSTVFFWSPTWVTICSCGKEVKWLVYFQRQ